MPPLVNGANKDSIAYFRAAGSFKPMHEPICNVDDLLTLLRLWSFLTCV